MSTTNTENLLVKLGALKPEVAARYKVREIGLFGSGNSMYKRWLRRSSNNAERHRPWAVIYITTLRERDLNCGREY